MSGRMLKNCLGGIGGYTLGQFYYYYYLKNIPFLCESSLYIDFIISVILGVGNAACTQMRCISCLLLPMYCGKAGRGVLKAVVLTYVIAGPITNMGLNAQEVVRVFACSARLSQNLSRARYALVYRPLNRALLTLREEVDGIKDTFRSIREVMLPIKYEIEGTAHLQQMKTENDFTEDLLSHHFYKNKNRISNNKTQELNNYYTKYLLKMNYRCENQLSHAVTLCMEAFSNAYDACVKDLPSNATETCSLLMLPNVCDVKRTLGFQICDSRKKLDPGLQEGYTYLLKAQDVLINNLNEIKMHYKIHYERELYDIQDAKETGERVKHAFEEKYAIIKCVIITVNVFMACLVLRIAIASQTYHDMYLTSIDYDNVYITGYFKKIDEKRHRRNKLTLLPLKKMERNRYIDVYSTSYISAERSKLLTQILKVMLEAVTATTFVMLDRLFFEALDVVRQHAMDTVHLGTQDLEIEVEGSGVLASMVRKVLTEINANQTINIVSNELCLPRPHVTPYIFYFKIYGGYLWILLLLYVNPYTLRLRRLICSYFYPTRERRRILHLYNDILKKRMKMQKTLRRKAVQAVRAHYLSGENLLSLRIRFPQVLGWLSALPMARMKCLICEETEPKYSESPKSKEPWHRCASARCPFVYCAECWREVRARCLACDPALAELSDMDSLSDDRPPRY